MKFQQLYSGSSGNLYIVTADNGKRLMIECGVTWPKLQQALNHDLSGIVGCIVSHHHADHCKAAKDVMKAGINVYASSGTFDALGLENERRAKVVANKTLIRLDSFEVLCFDTLHDSVEPLGFIVREKETNEFLLFATDTHYIQQRFKYPFSIIALEVSYDKFILQERVDKKTINEELARRLLTSHQEKEAAMRYLSDFCGLSKCKELHLLHMSAENIDKEKTRTEFEKRFFIKTRTVNAIHNKQN